MFSDMMIECTFDGAVSEVDFNKHIEDMCCQLDEQVNYVLEIDDSNKKVYINLEAGRNPNWEIDVAHMGIRGMRPMFQRREVFCKCGATDCSDAEVQK